MYHAQELQVRKNQERSRFELTMAGMTAVVDYLEMGKRILFTHTEVPAALEGQGIGSVLAFYVLEYARENDLMVIPLCPFIASYIREHPEYQYLVLAGFAI